MISLKRVLASDTIQVVRRIDWVSPEETTGGLGFTYDMYRHDYSPSKTASSGATKLYDSDFYVVNSQYQVYKCIYNGTSPSDPNGKPSTIEPTGTSTSIITTGDGYRWKYMYTIPVASVLKFFSSDYMPVFTNDAVRTNAVAGEIDTVVINSAGSGYNNGTYDNVAINGDGTGGRVSIVVDGGKITAATLPLVVLVIPLVKLVSVQSLVLVQEPLVKLMWSFHLQVDMVQNLLLNLVHSEL